MQIKHQLGCHKENKINWRAIKKTNKKRGAIKKKIKKNTNLSKNKQTLNKTSPRRLSFGIKPINQNQPNWLRHHCNSPSLPLYAKDTELLHKILQIIDLTVAAQKNSL